MTQLHEELHRLAEVALACGVPAAEVHIWVERRWVLPARDESGLAFGPADVARARLIAEMERDLGIDMESIPVVLALLDRVHALRRQVRLLTTALGDLPPDQQAVVCRRLAELEVGGEDAPRGKA